MATQQGQVTKIYELRTLGYDDLHAQLQAISKDFEAIKKVKADLENKKSKIQDPAELDALNKKITEAKQNYSNLQQQITSINKLLDSQSSNTSKLTGDWYNLIVKYQDAKKSADDILQTQGQESEVYQKAAAAAEAYGQQISGIITLTKNFQKGQALGASPEDLQQAAQLRIAIQDRNAQLTAEARLNAAATESINQYRAANKLLIQERNNVNTSTDEGKQKLNQLNAEIDANNEKIQQNVSILEKQKINIGNYEGSAKVIVQALQDVENKIAELKQKQQGLQDLNQRNPIGFKTQGGDDNLNNVTGQLKALEMEYETLNKITSQPTFLNLSGKLGDTRQEIGFLTSAMIEMENAGLKDSDAYVQLRDSLAKLQHEITETRAEIRALGSEHRNIDLFASGVQTLSSTFQAAASAEELLNGKNEDVQKSIAKLIAIQNISNGVRQIATDLTNRGTLANKVYAFFQAQLAIFTDVSSTAMERFIAVSKSAGIGLLIAGIGFLISKLISATDETTKLTDAEKFNKSVIDGERESYVKAAAEVEKMKAAIIAAKDGYADKTKVLKEYNDSLGKVIGKTNDLNDAENKLIEKGDAYVRAMVLRATANLFLEEAAKKAFNAEKFKDLTDPNKLLPDPKKLQDADYALIKANEDRNKKLVESNKKFNEQQDADVKGSLDKAKDLYDQFYKFVKDNGLTIDSTDDKSNPVKNQLAKIDALRDESLANEKTRVLEIKKQRDLTLAEEIESLQNIEKINLDALDSKIKYLSGLKKLDADELKQLAEFRRDRVDTELKTQQDIQKLRDDEFSKREKALKDQLQRDINAAKDAAKQIESDPTASAGAKAKAKVDADNQILNLQTRFNAEIAVLELELNQHSAENAKEGADEIRKIREDLNNDLRELSLSLLQDIDTDTEKQVANIKLKYDQLIEGILKSKKSASDKAAAIGILDKTQNVEINAAQLTGENDKLAAAKKLFDANLITAQQFEEIYSKAIQGQKNLNDAIQAGKQNITSLQSLLGNKLGKLFGFDEGSDKAKLFAETISQSFQLAKTAMDDYFQNEADRIKQSTDLQIQKLEIEKQQALDRAQSQAEQDSLNKQYAAKEDAANKAAFEKNKKLQKEQALINLAIQLSNLAVIAFAPNPENIATLGLFGAIMYGIQAAIAFANYALNVGRINSATYEKGGMVPTKTGGEIEGPSHANGGVQFQYEAEGKELAIVNKKSAQDNRVRTFTGTNKQILSLINEIGGGISFAKGATLHKFEKGGYLGDSLQAPVFMPSSNIVFASNPDLIDEIKKLRDDVNNHSKETSSRIDRLEVVQVTDTVTNAQKKKVKQSSINSL